MKQGPRTCLTIVAIRSNCLDNILNPWVEIVSLESYAKRLCQHVSKTGPSVES